MSRLVTALVGVLVLVSVLGGCGVPVQDGPVPIDTDPSSSRAPAPPSGALDVTVFLVREERLFPVARSTEDTTVVTTLELLMRGPDPVELAAGVSTALPPRLVGGDPVGFERRRIGQGGSGARVAVIEVTDDFTTISGDDQLLATAQVVWTVTGLDVADRVRITSDGESIELPTDDGLTASPVGRDDYRSVEPERPEIDEEPSDEAGEELSPAA